MLFSQRIGVKPIKNIIQIDSMDDDLKNGLWNCLTISYWSLDALVYHNDFRVFFILLSHDYFKEPVDNVSYLSTDNIDEIREYFFKCEWYEVYDLIDFIANKFPNQVKNEGFIELCNSVLEREVSGYRFVNGRLAQITSEDEIKEIEDAQNNTRTIKPVNAHFIRAFELLADRKSPDYRNSIKESVSSVESLCNLMNGGSKTTLASALKKLDDTSVTVHPALNKAFGSLYGYTSDASGIRHALLDDPNLDFEDAKFMLVSCSAFVNYLLVKAQKAGIKL